MKQYVYGETKRNLDRYIDEDKLLREQECSEWITEHLDEGKFLCDLFGKDKVIEAIKKINLNYKYVFNVEYAKNGSKLYRECILLKPKIAKNKEYSVGCGQSYRIIPSEYVDAYAVPAEYREVELSKLLRFLFFSIDERLSGKIFTKIEKGKISLSSLKINDLIKSYDIGEMSLNEAYLKFRLEEKEIDKEESKISLYCHSPYLVFIETGKGVIYLPLAGLIMRRTEDCISTMNTFRNGDDGVNELMDTPEYKKIKEIFFNKD